MWLGIDSDGLHCARLEWSLPKAAVLRMAPNPLTQLHYSMRPSLAGASLRPRSADWNPSAHLGGGLSYYSEREPIVPIAKSI